MKLSIDNKISFVASFIALLALFFSISDHYQNRSHNKKTVRPILSIEKLEIESKYGIFLSNQGYGPAIIDSCLVFYKNERINSENVWDEIFKKHFTAPIDFVVEKGNIKKELVVKEGAVKLVWGAKTNDLMGNRQILDNSMNPISIKIYYHSIYDEKSEVIFP